MLTKWITEPQVCLMNSVSGALIYSRMPKDLRSVHHPHLGLLLLQ